MVDGGGCSVLRRFIVCVGPVTCACQGAYQDVGTEAAAAAAGATPSAEGDTMRGGLRKWQSHDARGERRGTGSAATMTLASSSSRGCTPLVLHPRLGFMECGQRMGCSRGVIPDGDCACAST